PEAGSIVVVSGVHPVLDSIAVAMIAGARYRPGKMAGRPVRVLVAAPIDFLLGPGVEAKATGGVLTVELVDVKPRRIAGPPPRYPPHLQQSGIEGVVMLQAVLDTVGRAEPGSVRIVSSTNSGFNASAIESVNRSEFQPARLNGIAVRVMIQIPVSYTMAR
ncbi:MAG: TonB family protein, partial [Actinomycetota bacterium]